jgi:uncharacterized membrane protein YagU involved in acid resistance
MIMQPFLQKMGYTLGGFTFSSLNESLFTLLHMTGFSTVYAILFTILPRFWYRFPQKSLSKPLYMSLSILIKAEVILGHN